MYEENISQKSNLKNINKIRIFFIEEIDKN